MVPDILSIIPLNAILILVAAVLVIIVVIFAIVSLSKKGKKMSNRIDQFVIAETQPGEMTITRTIIPREVAGSLFTRTIGNWFNNFLQFVGKYTPERMAVNIEHKLTIAGNPGNMRSGTFFGVRILLLAVGLLFAILLNRDLQNINNTFLLVGILIVLFCAVLPSVWLNSQVRTRQNEIQRGLPDALDMLSVCASAGLGFDQSMQKISTYWDTELGKEFNRVMQEMKMGVSRSEALRHMSDRLEVSDLTQFIVIIIQAEKIGMSYANVLHSQALQLRVLRQLRAREIANKLPGKMMIPVVLFIFPAIMAVILGPTLPVLIDLF